MTRPTNLVECGSGYTTLFLLAACAENAADVAEESRLLREKSEASRSIEEWFGSGGKACGVDPGFYLDCHRPHLYSFEKLPAGAEYTDRVMEAVRGLSLTELFTYLPGSDSTPAALPAEAFPIDLAWNDDEKYRQFFEVFWPKLNPRSGLMIFHNTVAMEESWEDIKAITDRQASQRCLEMLTLVEPHELNQNSCTIPRRTTEYEPSFLNRTRDRILTDLAQLLASHR